jgi:diacylglycerol kinase (ATP)
MARRIAYILNPTAAGGRAREVWAGIERELRRRGLGGEALWTEGRDQAADLAQAHATSGADLVVAVGGDGTVRAVASGVIAAGGRVPLGVIPLGTGNDFARQAGVGQMDQAVAALEGGRSRRLDAIEVACIDRGQPRVSHALVFASVGFGGELLRWTTPRVKRWFGPRWCYSVGFLRALATYQAPQAVVRVAGAEYAGRWLHLCAGNAEWAGGGGMRLSPGARWDDGRLEVCLVEAMSRLATVWNFPKLVRGTFAGHPRVRYFQGDRLTIDAAHPQPLQLDGDTFGETPATLAVKPGCVAVVMPG